MAKQIPRQADELIQETRSRHIAGQLDNELLAAVRDSRCSMTQLRRLVAAEAQCHQAEIISYGIMSARFPGPLAVGFHLKISELVNAARPKLAACGEALGMTPRDLHLQPREKTAFSFPGTLSWIALQGSQAANALALHTDMEVYFPQCQQLVRELRSAHFTVPDAFLSYYDSGGSQELLDLAADVIEEGLRHGDDPEDAVFMAGVLRESIDDLWRAAAGGDTSPVRQGRGTPPGRAE